MFGGQEFIKSQARYCIWVEHNEVEDAYCVEELRRRFSLVKKNRLESTKKATQEWLKRRTVLLKLGLQSIHKRWLFLS